MIAFWISAALVSAAAAALIIHRAARAARTSGRADPALGVYQRQIAEIDDLAERGLLLDAERRSAYAEASRRLLAQADQAPTALAAAGRKGRLIVAAVAALAPLAAIAVYLFVGAPQAPDQPFAKRLAAWRAADLRLLAPDQLVAVLELVARERPTDPKVFYYLGRAQLAAGDTFSAIHSLHRSIDLGPRQSETWSALGDAYLAQASGEVSPEAVDAFRHANQIDPAVPAPRYYLARARIAGGDVAGGLAAWRALDHDLPAGDASRQQLDQEIAIVERTGALPQAPAETDQIGGGQQAFIRSMVEALAARLKAHPDDPAGWARLIRSYAVLGDEPDRAAALARARDLFKARPADLQRVEQASAGPQK